jgi:hypothetical protein
MSGRSQRLSVGKKSLRAQYDREAREAVAQARTITSAPSAAIQQRLAERAARREARRIASPTRTGTNRHKKETDALLAFEAAQ